MWLFVKCIVMKINQHVMGTSQMFKLTSMNCNRRGEGTTSQYGRYVWRGKSYLFVHLRFLCSPCVIVKAITRQEMPNPKLATATVPQKYFRLIAL